MNNGVDSADMELACVLLLLIGICMVMPAMDGDIIKNKIANRIVLFTGIAFMAIPLLKLVIYIIFN